VTAEDGQKVIVSQDNFDGDTVTVLVPHSTFFYRWTNAGQELSGSEAVMRGDCTLENQGVQLVLTCGPTSLPISMSRP
jgi:hypothetical protein